ncbi:hypothetical protein NLI96_g580 [Meripilus lineatus]|uniref:Uncharacterized protein n=1 Tax=Meripilus lineatus TaxID=2056292 RepID=A0AAD5YNV1_9APHY|nr:hypothetical protein NLI96_g580 [Physisporinus lineatus]
MRNASTVMWDKTVACSASSELASKRGMDNVDRELRNRGMAAKRIVGNCMKFWDIVVMRNWGSGLGRVLKVVVKRK